MPCADNEVNGVPMCANEALLNEQIRSNWSRPDTLIVTDCGAVSNNLLTLWPYRPLERSLFCLALRFSAARR